MSMSCSLPPNSTPFLKSLSHGPPKGSDSWPSRCCALRGRCVPQATAGDSNKRRCTDRKNDKGRGGWQDGSRAAEQQSGNQQPATRTSQMDATVTPTRRPRPPSPVPPPPHLFGQLARRYFVLCVQMYFRTGSLPQIRSRPMRMHANLCRVLDCDWPPSTVAAGAREAHSTGFAIQTRAGLSADEGQQVSRWMWSSSRTAVDKHAPRRAALKRGSVCFPATNGRRIQQTERQENSAEKGSRLHHLDRSCSACAVHTTRQGSLPTGCLPGLISHNFAPSIHRRHDMCGHL